MAKRAAVAGGLLVVLGLILYAVSDSRSFTALIPSMLGLPILLFGLVGLKRPSVNKHMMHGAAAFAVLGLIFTVGSFGPLLQWIGGGEIDEPLAVAGKSLTALICGVFVVMAVRSFIEARRARAEGQT